MLYPEHERKLVEAEFRKALLHPSPHFGLHIQRKDGRSVPVTIWSSEKLKLDGPIGGHWRVSPILASTGSRKPDTAGCSRRLRTEWFVVNQDGKSSC